MTPPAVTERVLLDALWARLTRVRNGESLRYIMAEHVRLDPTYAYRIADAVSVDTWASGGHMIEGYEVKVTRADWRREVRPDTSKSEPWRALVHRWWIVAPVGVVPQAELPDGWGLIEYGGGQLRRRVTAARVEPRPLPLSTTAAIMRAVASTAVRHATC